MRLCKIIPSLLLAFFAGATVAQNRILPQAPTCIFANGVLVRCANTAQDGAISLIQNGTRRHILSIETLNDLIGANAAVDYNDNGSCSAILKCPAGPDITSASQVVAGATPPRSTTTTTASTSGCPSSALLRDDSYFTSSQPNAKAVDRLFEIASAQECCA